VQTPVHAERRAVGRPLSDDTLAILGCLRASPAPARAVALALKMEPECVARVLSRLVQRGQVAVLARRRFDWAAKPLLVYQIKTEQRCCLATLWRD
jgi:hypothetical protein